MVWLPGVVKKSWTICLALSTQYGRVTDRQTDRRISCHGIVSAYAEHRGNNRFVDATVFRLISHVHGDHFSGDVVRPL